MGTLFVNEAACCFTREVYGAHTVAVAQQNNCLDSLLNSIARKLGGVSITKISDGGMPKSRRENPSTKEKLHKNLKQSG